MNKKNANHAGDVVYMVDTLGDPIHTISIKITACTPIQKCVLKLALGELLDRVYDAIDDIYLRGNIDDRDESAARN